MRRGGQEGGKRGKKQGFVGGKRKVTPTGYVETSTPGATIGILFSRAFPPFLAVTSELKNVANRDCASQSLFFDGCCITSFFIFFLRAIQLPFFFLILLTFSC